MKQPRAAVEMTYGGSEGKRENTQPAAMPDTPEMRREWTIWLLVKNCVLLAQKNSVGLIKAKRKTEIVSQEKAVMENTRIF